MGGGANIAEVKERNMAFTAEIGMFSRLYLPYDLKVGFLILNQSRHMTRGKILKKWADVLYIVLNDRWDKI